MHIYMHIYIIYYIYIYIFTYTLNWEHIAKHTNYTDFHMTCTHDMHTRAGMNFLVVCIGEANHNTRSSPNSPLRLAGSRSRHGTDHCTRLKLKLQGSLSCITFV